MGRLLPTASKLALAEACIGSAALDKAAVDGDYADRGKAIHAFLENYYGLGRDKALAAVPAEYLAACERIDIEKLPALGSVASEVGFAYDTASGAARTLKLTKARDYFDVKPTEIAGTADLVGLLGDDGVAVFDVKTGAGRIKGPAENLQLLLLALAAARVHGRQRAVVGLIFIGEDGDSRYVEATLDAFALDEAAVRLADLAGRVQWARKKVAKGESIPLAVNDGCKYCPSLLACPAQAGLIKRMAGDPERLGSEVRALVTPETAARAYQNAKAFGDALKLVWKALYAYAAENPIALPDGMVWGPVESKRESVHGSIAHRILEAEQGRDIADAAVTLEATKKSIEDALAVVAMGEGKPLAPMVREVLGAIREAGGIETKVSRTFKEHRPKPPMQLTPPTPALPRSVDPTEPRALPAPRPLAIVDVLAGESEHDALARAGR